MITHKPKWLLVGLVCLALWPAYTSAQGGLWETYMAAGVKAYQQGNYPEAEKQLGAALKEAEGFGPQDPRLAAASRALTGLFFVCCCTVRFVCCCTTATGSPGYPSKIRLLSRRPAAPQAPGRSETPGTATTAASISE